MKPRTIFFFVLIFFCHQACAQFTVSADTSLVSKPVTGSINYPLITDSLYCIESLESNPFDSMLFTINHDTIHVYNGFRAADSSKVWLPASNGMPIKIPWQQDTFVPSATQDVFIPKYQKYNWWRAGAILGIGLISGAAYGTHETSVHKPQNFPKSWNAQFWDNSLSWRNKYKYGDPFYGEKFPGSTTWFVATTDAKHMTSTIHKVGLFSGGVMVGVTIGQKKPWDHILVDALAFAAGYMIGFQSTYVYNAWNW